jgi:hypothetical protein
LQWPVYLSNNWNLTQIGEKCDVVNC